MVMAKNYWERHWDQRRLSRRALLTGTLAGAAGAGALIVVGCGDDDDDEPTEAPAAATEATAAATAAPTEAPTEAPAGNVPTDGGQYSFHRNLTGATLDMHRELYPGRGEMLSLAYNQLVAWDDIEQATIRGEIAQGLPEQPDELTYTFQIRDDVKFHDKPPANGRTLTMEDVRWNIERQRERKLADGTETEDFYRYSAVYQHVENVDYIDDRTFTITLEAPSVLWLSEMCDRFNVINDRQTAEAIELDYAVTDAQYILGTGPYVFEEYNLDTRARARRHPDYFLKAAGEEVQFFDELIYTPIDDAQAIRLAFEQKQLDIMLSTNDVISAVAEAQPDTVRLSIGEPNSNLGLTYPYLQSEGWNNRDIRQAIFVATDRVLSGQQYFQGVARPNPPVPWPFEGWALSQEELATTPGYRENKEEDIREARALWQAGGGEAVDPMWFEMTIIDVQDQSIKEWWTAMMNENLGTDKFSLHTVPVGTLLQYLVDQGSGGYLGGWTQWHSPDPRQRWKGLWGIEGNINFYKTTTPEMEELISEMFAEFDTERAKEILKEAQRFTLNDGGTGHVPISGSLRQYLHWPYLHGAEPGFLDFEKKLGRRAWIDQTDPTYAGKPTL